MQIFFSSTSLPQFTLAIVTPKTGDFNIFNPSNLSIPLLQIIYIYIRREMNWKMKKWRKKKGFMKLAGVFFEGLNNTPSQAHINYNPKRKMTPYSFHCNYRHQTLLHSLNRTHKMTNSQTWQFTNKGCMEAKTISLPLILSRNWEFSNTV